MARPRTARSTLDKPKNRAQIVAWLAEGHSASQIAALLAERHINTTRQAVSAFSKRHRAEVDAITGAAVAKLEQAAITDKAERIRIREWYLEQLHGIMRERGPLAREPRWVTVYAATDQAPTNKDGDPLPAKVDDDGHFLEKLGEKLVEVAKVDTALYKTAGELLNDVARELGELPRPNDAIASLHFTKIDVHLGDDAGDADEPEPRIIDA